MTFAMPDRTDVATLGGLAILTIGIGKMSIAWAMVVAGSILLVLGLASAVLSVRRRP